MNQAEAMELLGVRSRATWARWVKAGLPRRPRGRGFTYDEDEMRAWLTETDTKLGTQGGDTAGGQHLDHQELYERERALKTAAERELRELKLAEERGELVRADEVLAKWSDCAVKIRACLLGVPAEVAASVYAAQSELEVEELLRDAVRAVLTGLASG